MPAGHGSAPRESAEQPREVLDAIPQLAWSPDASGEEDYSNRRWTEFTGLSRE